MLKSAIETVPLGQTLPLDFTWAAIVIFGLILFVFLYLNGPTTIVFSKDRFNVHLIVANKIQV